MTALSIVRSRTISRSLSNRAIVYSEIGSPASVLFAISYPQLPPPPPGTANVKFILAPINPADINVIEGVYPSRPAPKSSFLPSGKGTLEHPVFVAGNEGLAEVTEVGSGVTGLHKGDRVIITKQQAGTWTSGANLRASDVLRIPRIKGRPDLSDVHGATMTVNPPTAYNMLQDFVSLEEGDWVLQNGANSAVGQAVIQIAASKGLKTMNFVRDRPDIEALRDRLQALGAHHVLTYEELLDKNLRKRVTEWTAGKEIRLALNCVGGKETSLMAGLLGQNAHLVSYGAMSKQPLSLPTSSFIFKNLTCHGFWQSRWYLERSRAEREKMMEDIAGLMRNGQLQEPESVIVTLGGKESDEEVTQKVRDIFMKLGEGRFGRKVLLKVEEIAE